MNKKGFIIAIFCLIISAMTFAQVPQKMSYQAVVRGSDNNLVTNSEVSVRVSILQGSVDGEAVYTETHSATTNANGLLTIEIGTGAHYAETFSSINWANGPYFVKTETDVNGGSDYDIIGVSQLLAVPYAMYAQTAGNVPDVSGFLTEETDPTVPEWAKAETKPQYDYSEIENTPEIPELQVLTISNDTIFLTNGGFVKLPPAPEGFSGDYNDLTNRPEIPTIPTNVSAFENDANYVINEADPTIPAWAKAENKPVYSYSEIEGIPEIPTVPTNVSAFDNDANYMTSESDPSVPAWAKAENKPVYNYSEIEGTPIIPTVPTNVSAFTNDANYLTSYTETQTLANVVALGNSAGNNQIKNVAVPTEEHDAATKEYVDAMVASVPAIPTNVSAFDNDVNYLTSETDPTVPAWAKANAKPTYDYSEIQNTPNIPTIPNTVSAFDNDANYLQSESQTLADVVALGNSVNAQLKNVTDPTEDHDAATKKYIDDIIAPILVQNAELQARIEEIEHFNFIVSLNAHDFVDLGLPSGTKWATCNIGATNPEDYGDYFAWGETSTKNTYSWATYSLCNGSQNTLTKYCNNSSYGNNGFTDALTTLEASDDAATANWGSAWRMPTKEEFVELKNNCTVTWTTQNGVNGRLFTGPNGNSIFLPAAGFRVDDSLYFVGSYGDYWSSSLYTGSPDHARNLYFNSGNYDVYSSNRFCGFTVRPVCVSAQN